MAKTPMLLAPMLKAVTEFSKTVSECRRYSPHLLIEDLQASLPRVGIADRRP
jgi:hypothetical protein